MEHRFEKDLLYALEQKIFNLQNFCNRIRIFYPFDFYSA